MAVMQSKKLISAMLEAVGAEEDNGKVFIDIDEIRIKFGENTDELFLSFVKNGEKIADVRNMLPRGCEFCIQGVSYKLPLTIN